MFIELSTDAAISFQACGNALPVGAGVGVGVAEPDDVVDDDDDDDVSCVKLELVI